MNIYGDNISGHVLMERVTPYLNKQGHRVYTAPQGCNVQLSFVRTGWRGNLPIVQRIDGIYSDQATDYNGRNAAISSTHSIAHGVIYQSDYSRRLCEMMLTPRNKSAKVSVIYNGIEPDWCGSHIDQDRVDIVILGKHRRHKRLKEIVDIFIKYNKVVENSVLHVFGLMHDNKPVNHPCIKYYGHVARDKMFGVLRTARFSLHLSKRDSCPNSVLETISAGIPVITTSECGGATEMAAMTPGCVICPGDFDTMGPYYPYRDESNVITPELEHNILDAMMAITEDRRRVELPEQLTAKYCADAYIKIMESVL